MLNTPLAIAEASIRHRRYMPKAHAFEAKFNYLWLDPDQLERITAQSLFWSAHHWNILNLYSADFLTDYQGSLRQKVEQVLAPQAEVELLPDWQIRILALPRCLGFRFNSVVFWMGLVWGLKPIPARVYAASHRKVSSIYIHPKKFKKEDFS